MALINDKFDKQKENMTEISDKLREKLLEAE